MFSPRVTKDGYLAEACDAVAKGFTEATGRKLVIPPAMAKDMQAAGCDMSLVQINLPIPTTKET